MTMNLTDLWENASRQLRTILRPDVYERWIAVISPVEWADHQITLAVDNDFYQTWLEENYLPLIKTALATVAGAELTVRFVIQPREPSAVIAAVAAPEEPRPAARETPPPRAKAITLNPKFTFDQFVVGPSNSFSHAACMAVAQAPARAYNPLFIYGAAGLGKTHLMQAIGHHVLSTSRAGVCYVSSETMLNEYIQALQQRSLVAFRKKYRTSDLLLIDDIHFLAGKNSLQEEFFHTFNTLFDARRQIIMTSDRPAAEIAGLEQRLVTRFEWGLVTELEKPDLETRLAILKNKLHLSKAHLSEEALQFIAENVKSNIRSLEGALVRAVSFASLTGQTLTLDALRRLLKDMIVQEKAGELTFDGIQRAVAEHFDVRLADMSSKRRPRDVAVPRQVAMFLCRRLTRSSLPDIAGAFGKTHATILHACKAVDGRMDVDERLRQDVTRIAHKLGRAL